MKKKILSIALSLCMVLTMMPMATGVAWAAAASSVRIGTATLDSTNSYYHNGTDGAQGEANATADGANATFDAVNGTLTLNGLNLTSGGIKATGDLTIELEGENTLKNNSDYGGCAIYVGGDLTISGPGKLVASNKENESTTIYASGSMTINGGAKVTATHAGGRAQAINAADGDIVITDSATVVATNNGSYALLAGKNTDSKNINVSNGATLIATGSGQAVKGTTVNINNDNASSHQGNVLVGDSAETKQLWSNEDVKNQPLTGFKYLEITAPVTSPYAMVENTTINGTVNSAITDTYVTISLLNDTFKPTLAGSWITNLPAGLSQSVAHTSDTAATITISGTPTATSTDALAITIPAENLASNSALTVATNTNAKYNISTPPTVPGEPTSVSAVAGDGQATITFTAPESNGGAEITGYTVTSNPDNITANGNGSPITITGLTNETSYTFTVVATNSVGSSAASAASNSVTPTAVITHPDKPTIAVTGTYTYNCEAQTATVTGYDPATMDITGNKETNAGSYTVSVTSKTGQWSDGSSEAVKTGWTILNANQDAPTGLGTTAPTSESTSDGTITGVGSGMEYKKSTEEDSAYQPVTGSTITNLAAGTYNVRYAAKTNYNASPVTPVTIPAYNAPAAAATPVISPNGGTFTDTQTVTITCATNDAKIYYTTDGTEPTTGSTKYTGEFVISASTTVKAIAVKDGMTNSVVTTATFTKSSATSGTGGGGSYIPPVQKPVIGQNDNVKTELSSDGTKLTIKVADGYEITDVLVNGVSKGKVTEITGLKTGDKVEVKTEKKQEEPKEPTKEEIVAALDSSKLVARSKFITLKNGKKAVRITWYDKNGNEGDFDGVEIYRSTQRYKGYGLKPFYSTKGGKTEGYYVNTRDLKEGTTYYYKVRGYVEIDGQKYYTDYSLKAIRTIK